MALLNLSPEQEAIIRKPIGGHCFLEGPAGTGKTTAGVGRLLHLLYEGIPAESILILAPQRSLAGPYYDTLRRPDLPPGGVASVTSLDGLGQRLIDLFWPMIAEAAGFSRPDLPPTFLTMETAQYYMARLVQPLIEQGYFETVAVDRNRMMSQVLDNLNKAATVGFDSTAIAERLKSAWVGKPGDMPTQMRVYDEAQEVANLFRHYCLEHNLLDFSLQMEVFVRVLWPSMLCRQYLAGRFQHLIFDNLEEDRPVVHDILLQWLPSFQSSLLIYDTDGGYRYFLGADSESAMRLKGACDEQHALDQSWVISPELESFRCALGDSLARRDTNSIPAPQPSVKFVYQQFSPQMVEWIGAQVADMVYRDGVQPGEIAILSPFMSDSLRFTLSNRLEREHLPVRTHRPSRSLRDEPATNCLLTFARLAHPQWNLPCSRQDVRYALMQAIQGMDLVRADILAKIVYRENHPEDGLGSFDQIKQDMQERVTDTLGGRFEGLRRWLQEYREGESEELDVFLSRLFGEVLSQPDYGFHENYDAAAVTARLIELVQKFRWAVSASIQGDGNATGKEYIRMVEDGVLAAQYLMEWDHQPDNAVLIAPAYTFIMMNHPVEYQFWLDMGSMGWWERLSQPLTHPYVLSRRWKPDAVWTDVDEYRTNQESLARLASGLVRRCREKIYLCHMSINEQGDEPRGPLLQACQMLLRRKQIEMEARDV